MLSACAVFVFCCWALLWLAWRWLARRIFQGRPRL